MAFSLQCSSRVRAGSRACGRKLVARAADRNTVATPYARGILEVAQERNELDAVHGDLMGLQAMLAPAPIAEGEAEAPKNDLRDFILGVPLNVDERKEVISTIAKETNMSNTTKDFLKLLVDVGRLDAIENIIRTFDENYNTITETQIVTLRSAARLEQDQEFEIAKQLQEITNSKNIKIKPVVDEELIGGFVVEYGDNRVDLSIKGHLDRLESELLAGPGQL